MNLLSDAAHRDRLLPGSILPGSYHFDFRGRIRPRRPEGPRAPAFGGRDRADRARRQCTGDAACVGVGVGKQHRQLARVSTTGTTSPEVDGRELLLTVALVVQWTGVTWNRDDGTTPTFASEPGSMAAPGRPGTRRTRTTTCRSTGSIPRPYPFMTKSDAIRMSALQQRCGPAFAIWQDAQGRHQVSLGSFPLSIPVAPAWALISQIDGTPDGPSTTSCW
jgi:hypothetical protein